MREAQNASEPEALVRWLAQLGGTIAAVGLEAGPLWQWLRRKLTDAGLDVVLMETRQVKGALKAMPIKTDRRDAEGISRVLHLGWFRPVLLQVRLGAGSSCSPGCPHVHAAGLHYAGAFIAGIAVELQVKVGTISRGRFEQRIQELTAGNPKLFAATEPMLRARASLRPELAGLERRVWQLAQDDPVSHRLMSMPGVGAVVALTYRSAIDDPFRSTSS